MSPTSFFSMLLSWAFIGLNLLPFSAQQDPIQEVVAELAWARRQAEAAGSELPRRNRADCVRLYEDSERRIGQLVTESYGSPDAATWLSGAMAAHSTCVDGLGRRPMGQNDRLWAVLRKALTVHVSAVREKDDMQDLSLSSWNSTRTSSDHTGLLASWNPSMANATDAVVAQDGSGHYRTIHEALAAVKDSRRRGGGAGKRAVIYVKSGVYKEYVEIGGKMENVMLVGDGMDKTIVTGDRNAVDGYTTFRSATFGVSGDGFWARDMTFQNTAGPGKHQAVALRVNSDRSVFYRCGFRGYQDTLFVHSLRQFYRECHIHGTVDFVLGNAAAVFQDCDMLVRKPMDGQSNMITAQSRGDMGQNTGIVVHGGRVRPAPDFAAVKGEFRSYLGRPWGAYSRTVFLKTDIDGLVDPSGWARWDGDFAIRTLYYGEYMNTGHGADTARRVKWPGFHLLRMADEVAPFTVERFVQGTSWIPETGVPFWSGI